MLLFSGIHQEVAAGTLSAALVPWLQAARVIALPRVRPVSRATREVVAALKEICLYPSETGQGRKISYSQ
jgi:LysR family nitrogen assimilation transcriptional regulator